VRNNKTSSNLNVHQEGGRPSTGILEILETAASIAEI
jgi:hypothetical protein